MCVAAATPRTEPSLNLPSPTLLFKCNQSFRSAHNFHGWNSEDQELLISREETHRFSADLGYSPRQIFAVQMESVSRCIAMMPSLCTVRILLKLTLPIAPSLPGIGLWVGGSARQLHRWNLGRIQTDRNRQTLLRQVRVLLCFHQLKMTVLSGHVFEIFQARIRIAVDVRYNGNITLLDSVLENVG